MKDFCTFCGVYEGCAKKYFDTVQRNMQKNVLVHYIKISANPIMCQIKKNRTLVLIIILI